MTDYALYMRALAPGWLRGQIASHLWNRLGGLKDEFVLKATNVVKLWLVDQTDPSLVRDLADERHLLIDMPEKDLRARVQHAWRTWQAAGTADAIVTALKDVGYGRVSVREGTDWTFRHPWWFAVVLEAPYPWGTGVPTERDKRLVLAIVNLWKPAHTHLFQVIVMKDGHLQGDVARWGNRRAWGGSVLARWSFDVEEPR